MYHILHMGEFKQVLVFGFFFNILSPLPLSSQPRILSEVISQGHISSASLSCLCMVCCFFYSFPSSPSLKCYSAKPSWPLLILFWEAASHSVLLKSLLIQHLFPCWKANIIFNHFFLCYTWTFSLKHKRLYTPVLYLAHERHWRKDKWESSRKHGTEQIPHKNLTQHFFPYLPVVLLFQFIVIWTLAKR